MRSNLAASSVIACHWHQQPTWPEGRLHCPDALQEPSYVGAAASGLVQVHDQCNIYPSQARRSCSDPRSCMLWGASCRPVSVEGVLRSKEGGSVHPAVLALGLKYADGSIKGSTARCVAMVHALSQVRQQNGGVPEWLSWAIAQCSDGLCAV